MRYMKPVIRRFNVPEGIQQVGICSTAHGKTTIAFHVRVIDKFVLRSCIAVKTAQFEQFRNLCNQVTTTFREA